MFNRKSDFTNRKSIGFTILELMVVIGIITILIGIALPAIRGVQKAAKNATTTNLISTIAAAIDQYQGVQRDWPGPFTSDPAFEDRLVATGWDVIPNNGAAASAPFQYLSQPLKVTRSEELLLCLSGGMAIQRNATAPFAVAGPNFTYNPEDLDRGHISLSVRNRGRIKPFMPPGTSRSDTKATDKQFADDSLVPEFTDAYGTPILYVRAYKGITNTQAYYTYANASDPVINGGPLLLEARRYVDNAFILFPPNYCEHPSLTNQAVQQDRYILVSAGSDKKFGTADDLTNFDRK